MLIYINGVGTATYQWYENTVNNNSGVLFQEQLVVVIRHLFLILGSYYYYCEITLSGNGCDVAVSNTALIIVVDVSLALHRLLISSCVKML